MEKLHKSTNGYVKWISRRGESFEDKEKAFPVGFVGRMMVAHGEDFDPNSQYGNCLIGTIPVLFFHAQVSIQLAQTC